MADASVEELMRVESQLTRSFIGSVAGYLATLGFMLFLATPRAGGVFEPVSVWLLLVAIQLGFYIWYAVAAGAAAKALGEAGWKYVVWILVAPILALIPIPIVSAIISISPLSIKFLLGGQLQAAIRQASFEELHGA